MSFDYTGSFSGSFSGSFTGEIISSNGVISSSAQIAASLPVGVISSSAQVTDGSGFISQSNQVNYTQVKNKPTTISAFQKNSVIANNRFREVTYPAISSSVSTRLTDLEAQTDDTGSDSQTLSFNQVNNNLTISDGNSVDLSTLAGGGGGGGSSIWSTGSDYYFVSSNLQVTGSFKVSENVIADSLTGSIDWTNIDNTPSGILSSSTQVVSSLPSGVVSGSSQVSYDSITNVPIGILSASSQIADDISGSLSATAIADLSAGILSGSITTSSITNFDTEVSRSVAEAGFGSGGDLEIYSDGDNLLM